MTTTEEGSAFVARLVRGALPIVVCLLLLGLGINPNSSSDTIIAVCAVGAVVLWFGWNSIRRNAFTKWIGILVVLFLGLILGRIALAIAIGILILVFPLVVYDLFFHAPSEGQSSNGSAEPPSR